MAPYAHALKELGHEVAFATGEGFAKTIGHVGFEHFACGVREAATSSVLTNLAEWSAIAARFAGAPPGLAQLHAFVEVLAPRMATDLEKIVDSWRPDLIVRDPLEFGGYIAAERAQIPHAVVEWAIHIPSAHIAAGALHALRRNNGLPFDDLATVDGHLALSAMPAAWADEQLPVSCKLQRYRVEPFDDYGHEEDNVEDLLSTLRRSGRPLVYATLGTTFNESPDVFGSILDALGAEDVSGIVTVGMNLDLPILRQIPENVHVARYIPQTRVLAACDAMIFHAGFNSLHSALWHGVPTVMIPMGAGDQMPNAIRAASLGIGVIQATPIDTGRLRKALRTVLSEPRFRAQTIRLRDAMHALPPLRDGAHCLEALARYGPGVQSTTNGGAERLSPGQDDRDGALSAIPVRA